MKMEFIKIHGAREHNLKNINLRIPKYKIVVVTGLSGSGKSSLVFDTVYAEGQRRYVESLSAYARQFLEQMEKPDVEKIEGLSPAIAIQQHSPGKNPRSTVGTVTEIYDYLRLLYSKIGKPHCHICGRRIKSWSVQEVAETAFARYLGKRIFICSPLVRGRTGTYEELFARLRKKGFVKVLADSKTHDLSNPPKLSRYKKHTIELFIDEVVSSADEKERILESIELAMTESRGYVNIYAGEDVEPETFSSHNACPRCLAGFPELEPRLFSFNSPYGACGECSGLGVKIEIDENLVVPDARKTLSEGAVHPWSNPITTRTHRWKRSWASYYGDLLSRISAEAGIPLDVPWNRLSAGHRRLILHGWNDFEGVLPNLRRRYETTQSDFVKEEIDRRYNREIRCPACRGRRLRPESLSVTVAGKNIADVSALPISEIHGFVAGLNLSEKENKISDRIIKEIKSRLEFLLSVGIGYISLDRRSDTLSGGEAQRIQLATQIGSMLSGVIYALDEPTIGLHQKDNARLIATLKSLRDLGNTLLIVEHDEEIMRNADHIIDLGPFAGQGGGEVVAEGTVEDLRRASRSLTGRFLGGKENVETFKSKSLRPSGFLEFRGAQQFNLKKIDVKVPLGVLTSICGVSGSGKSTLLHEIVYKALARRLYKSKEEPGKFQEMKGDNRVDKVIIVDQSPIGRTPRSNPATYSGVFSHIRRIFAELPQARRKGYKAGRFSFNVPGGRCEACKGDGVIKIQMQFLPDVYVKCEECGGRRFTESTLEVRFKGKNIFEILDMPAQAALELFSNIPPVKKILKTLCEVGLGYIKLGQSAPTLSGGEAQRLKLAQQLARKSTGKTLYILDEPTTGLHFADVEKLVKILRKLTENGNSVVIIEHNLDVIAASDWIIELGPGGGDEGGYLVYSGPAKNLPKFKKSATAPYLERHLAKR